MSFARLSSRVGVALIASCFVSVFTPTSHAQVCPFDDGNSTLAVEGLILTRYALGITGAPLVASTGINAVDAPTVEAAINCPSCGLNITGNPTLTVADATIISRKLAGFSGDALTNGVALGSGTRNTPAAVQSFLLSGCGATGGTVTSITAGSGLTGGTITGSGTIAVNTAVIQNRVSGTCVVGSSIRAIAADGSVTCQTDTSGGTGTVTNVATGLGLTGGPVTSTGTIAADTNYLQRRVSASCAVGSSIRAIAADGTVTCQTDTGGGSGTVTNVASGTGLTGGPIIATGTLSIADPFRLPQSCANGQLAKYNTTTQLWECAADNGGGGTVTNVTTGLGLTGGPVTTTGTISADTTYLQRRVSASCAVGSSIRAIAVDGTVTCQTDTTGGSGTVTNVATGVGLTGGPVTTSGTIGLAATQLLPTTACANNQIPKWNGSAWLCATEAVGGTGTVTNVASGTGLSGGPITATGTLSIANPFRLPQSCVDGQIAKYNSNTQLWECATDNGGGGTVTSVGAGIGLNGGPVTTSGTLAIAPSFRLPQTCANGQFTRFNNTLNLWECVTPAVVTNVGTGPGLTGGPITSTGTVNLASTQLLPTTACANGEIAKWNGTAWACAAAASGAGTVTSVATGPGLSGGPITSTGTVSLAPTQLLPTSVCSTDQIIKWNGAAWVCAPPAVTLPGGCVAGQVLQIGVGGTIVGCGSIPPSIAVLADLTTNSIGNSSLAIPPDGLPVISFYDPTLDDLKLLKCGNPSCNSGNTVTTVDGVGFDVGEYNSVAIANDGFPIISYIDYSGLNADLKVAKCGNASCGSGNTITTVDSAGAVGRYNSIVVPLDGLPIISYRDETNQDLKVVKCGNASCSSGNTITAVDTAGDVGSDISIAVSADGFPVISYVGSLGLKVLKCGNASCNASNTIITVDGGLARNGTGIVVPPSGFPIISYYTPALTVVRCGSANCSSGNTQFTVDNTITLNGYATSIAISTDGFPVISYADGVTGRAKVAKCGSGSCSAGNTITTINSVDNVRQYYVPMKLSADGNPVIALFKSGSSFDYLLVKCTNVGCVGH